MSCNFDVEVFLDAIGKSKYINEYLQRDIKRAIRLGRGLKAPKVVPGGVYRSPRGLRLLTQANCYLNLIAIAGAGTYGNKVGVCTTGEAKLLEYMIDHGYEYLGELSCICDIRMHWPKREEQ